MIRRFYLTLDERQVHVVSAGCGPALVMLHALPLWAPSLGPLIRRLAARFTVVAPDLAGYGLSDPLAGDVLTTADYAADLARVLDLLGVGAFALYAAEESAPVAAQLASLRPGQVRALVLDEPCQLSPDEQVSLLGEGLPSFAPDPAGSHLLRLWDAARSRYLFRPAHVPRLANRLDRAMAAPAELDEVLKAYLRAGEQYPSAIRAGIAVPLAGALASLTLPVLVLAQERVAAARLPPPGARLRIERIPTDPERRAASIERFMGDVLPDLPATLRTPAARDLPPGRFSRVFIPVPDGYLHARLSPSGAGRPVLALHDPAGSHALVLPFVQGMLGTRPVIALDMPGNGESDYTLGTDNITSARYAQAVLEAIDALGIAEVDLVGRYSGGPVGMEMSFQRPQLVKHLVQAAIDLYAPEDVTEVLQHYTPSVAPNPDGSHLVRAWFNMKNQALYWPWFRQTRTGIVWGEPQLDARLIHQRVFDLLRVGDRYAKAYAAMWTYPMAERLPKLTVPTLLCAPRWDPLYAGLERAHRVGSQCHAETLPDRFAEWAGVFMRFFDAA